MPYAGRRRSYRSRKASRRSYRKRSFSRKGYSARTGPRKGGKRWSKWKNALPQSGYFKFKYTDTAFTAALAVGNGYQVDHVFEGNGMFDPDVTGVGVQPYGFDNYCNANAPYGAYLVYASKIKVFPYFIAEQQHPVKINVLPLTRNTLAYEDPSDVYVNVYSKSMILRSNNDDRKTCLQCYQSTKRQLGTLDSKNRVAYNANPDFPWFWHVNADSSAGATTTDLYYDVVITYYARLLKEDDSNES